MRFVHLSLKKEQTKIKSSNGALIVGNYIIFYFRMAKKNLQTKEVKEEKRKKLKQRVTQKEELGGTEPKKKKRSVQVGHCCLIQYNVDRLLPVVFRSSLSTPCESVAMVPWMWYTWSESEKEKRNQANVLGYVSFLGIVVPVRVCLF